MSDWAAETADTIERFVATVRDKTVKPATAVSRGVVFGLLASFFAGAATILFAVAVFRLLAIAMPVWAAWLLLGGIFVLGGGFCWSRRSPREGNP